MIESLKKFALENEGVLDVLLPNGEAMMIDGKHCQIVIHSPATDEFRKAIEARNRESAKRLMEAAGNVKKGADADAEAKFYTAITKSLVNFPADVTPAALYRESSLTYITTQVEKFAGEMGNFYKG